MSTLHLECYKVSGTTMIVCESVDYGTFTKKLLPYPDKLEKVKTLITPPG